MIKITLANGVVVETDSPVEASKTIHSLYWREFRGADKEEVSETRTCKICNGSMVGISKKAVYCSNACAKEGMIRARRRYYKTHREQIKEYARAWKEKKLDINGLIDQYGTNKV